MKKILSLPRRFISWFLRSSKKVKLAGIILLLVAIAAIGGSNQKSPKDAYLLEKVKTSSLQEIVTESGTIITAARVDVASPTNGIVEEVLVENGDLVKKDQVLFKVISSATDVERQTAYANYLSAKSSLALAQAQADTLRAGMYTNWESYRTLATNDHYETNDGAPKSTERESAEFQASKDTWSASEKRYKDSQTVIAAAKAAFNAASISYQATQNATVKAQIAGNIANVSVAEGNSVTAPSATNINATPVLSITGSKDVQAMMRVGQTDILKVKMGQKVSVMPDAFKDKKFSGQVTRVDELGTNTQGVVTYAIYIDIDRPDASLKSGMTMDADIVTKKLDDILTVPSSAVVLYKGGKAVRVLNDKNEIKYLPVKTGIKGDSRTQIISGIEEGTEIIVSLNNDQAKRPGGFGF